MAKYDLNYSEFERLGRVFDAMTVELKNEIKSAATQIGNQLKSNTEASIPRGAVAKHGVHLADEVKMSISSNDKRTTITVKGGKKTGGYWWIVDNGHIAQNGKFVGGAHFTDKAYSMTNVDGPVQDMIDKVVSHE